MKIRVEGGLLYVSAELLYRSQKLTLSKVILDTGSAGTLFSADEAVKLGLVPEPNDPLRRVRGVGGSEFVFSKRLDSLSIGELEQSDFQVQIGANSRSRRPGFPNAGWSGHRFGEA